MKCYIIYKQWDSIISKCMVMAKDEQSAKKKVKLHYPGCKILVAEEFIK